MIIRAVFFDWFNTLARYDPPRHELYGQLFRQFGIGISAGQIMHGVAAADQYYLEENSRSPVEKRSPEAQSQVWVEYQRLILAGGGVTADKALLLKLIQAGRQLFKDTTFVLFDDVLPTFSRLDEQGFVLGLLTNLTRDVGAICRKLGLGPLLDFVVSSGEIGVDKPSPRFFLAALEKAGVQPREAVHVGDQYRVDVVGARGVGINPILIDRYDLHPDISDCPRIHSLAELAPYLQPSSA